MRYIIAVLCPPLAIYRAGKPLQAILAILLLGLAWVTWSDAIGVLIAAFVLLWAARVAGEQYASEELASFMRLFQAEQARR